ncbi:MAG: hypothetical protein ACJ787_08145, partial [Myxococcales bacterium]
MYATRWEVPKRIGRVVILIDVGKKPALLGEIAQAPLDALEPLAQRGRLLLQRRVGEGSVLRSGHDPGHILPGHLPIDAEDEQHPVL